MHFRPVNKISSTLWQFVSAIMETIRWLLTFLRKYPPIRLWDSILIGDCRILDEYLFSKMTRNNRLQRVAWRPFNSTSDASCPALFEKTTLDVQYKSFSLFWLEWGWKRCYVTLCDCIISFYVLAFGRFRVRMSWESSTKTLYFIFSFHKIHP